MDNTHLTPDARQRVRDDLRSSRTKSRDSALYSRQSSPNMMNPNCEGRRTPRKLVLCFDGTGNKFRGDDSDSNILKIFRCLDREAGGQCE